MAQPNPSSIEGQELIVQLRQRSGYSFGESMPRPIPSKKESLSLLFFLNFSPHIIKHQEAVMRKALDLAHHIKSIPLNLDLIRAGALLHDIGRLRSHDLDHTAYGGDLLRTLGYPEELARIAETHGLGGLKPEEAEELGIPIRNYIPITWEEKIVCLADKYLSGTDQVTIEGRFKRWLEKYGETPFLREQIRRVKSLEEEILKLIYVD
jgi:uncharacterized protein